MFAAGLAPWQDGVRGDQRDVGVKYRGFCTLGRHC